MQLLEEILNELRSHDKNSTQYILPSEIVPYLGEHELINAYYSLLSKKKHPSFDFKIESCGAISLFHKCFFPWEGLPHPKEHAELGTLLLRFEDEQHQQFALNMENFQQATLDHEKKPLFSLYRQERGCSYSELMAANINFFAALQKEAKSTFSFLDTHLGFFSKRDSEKSFFCTGAGCKSGLAAFLYKDAGILNCGPQFLPLGDCEAFGLAGRPSHFQFNEDEQKIEIDLRCRLAAPHPRETFFKGLHDSGYSGMWLSAHLEHRNHEIRVSGLLEGNRPIQEMAFSFFVRANACYVAGSHKLSPRSLDRYIGPHQEILIKSEQGQFQLDAQSGLLKMEIIPLIGGDHFWGSDFLIAYTFKEPEFSFSINY